MRHWRRGFGECLHDNIIIMKRGEMNTQGIYMYIIIQTILSNIQSHQYIRLCVCQYKSPRYYYECVQVHVPVDFIINFYSLSITCTSFVKYTFFYYYIHTLLLLQSSLIGISEHVRSLYYVYTIHTQKHKQNYSFREQRRFSFTQDAVSK